MTTTRFGGTAVRISDPAIVAVSAPGEKRWGYHQFPTISRLPDTRLLVTFNDGPDRDDYYGTPGPAYVSSDEGVTWTEWDPPDPLLSVSHSVISEVYGGQYLCAPMSPSLGVEENGIELPEPSGRADAYGEVLLYRLSECSADVQAYMATFPSTRWSPETGKWTRQDVLWETAEALVRTRKSDYVLPRPFIDNRILRYGGALYYPEYHSQYLLPDGQHPRNFACWCMVSHDNGLTWTRGGLIAHDPSGELMMGEPCLMPTSDGNLACVIRCTHHRREPMRIAYSSDGGLNWSDTTPICDFGVMPQALLLGNGVSALAFGRPGVHLLFSPDGLGRHWVGPLSIIEGDREAASEHSCGYTRLLPVAEDAFLIAYSDFKHVENDGQVGKSIAVRRIEMSQVGL